MWNEASVLVEQWNILTSTFGLWRNRVESHPLKNGMPRHQAFWYKKEWNLCSLTHLCGIVFVLICVPLIRRKWALGHEIYYNWRRVTFEKCFTGALKVRAHESVPLPLLAKKLERSLSILKTCKLIVKCWKKKENLREYRKRKNGYCVLHWSNCSFPIMFWHSTSAEFSSYQIAWVIVLLAANDPQREFLLQNGCEHARGKLGCVVSRHAF